MSRCKTLLLSSLWLLAASPAMAAPRYKAIPSIGWSLDRVIDETAMGDVTGTTAAFTNLVSCTVGTDANGNLICSASAGSGTVTSIAQGTNMSFSVNPITTAGTINLAASPSVTNLTATGTITGAIVDITTADARFSGLTANRYVKSNANSVLTSAASPIPVADGGTGTTTSTGTGNVVLSASPTLTGTVSASVINATGTITGLTVAMTGTICSGTDKLSTDSGGNVICASDQTGGGTNHNILSATHTDSVAGAATRGDLIVANSTPAWDKFAVGGTNTVLTANATDPSWSATPTVTNLTATGTITGAIVDISTADVRLSGLSASAYVKTNANKVLVSQTTPIAVTDGGTGDSTLTQNGVVYGNGTAAAGITAQGGTNTVLTANAGAPSFSASPTVTNLTATSTVTGLVISATGNLQVGSDSLTDITGSGLSIVGGALTASAGSGDITDVGDCTTGAALGGACGTTISIGTGDVADAGAIRLQNATNIAWEASPAGTDVTLTVNSSEQLVSSGTILANGGATIPDDQMVDLSASNASSTTDGLKLPQNTTCASATAEGQVCWDSDDDQGTIGDGTTANVAMAVGNDSVRAVRTTDTANFGAGVEATVPFIAEDYDAATPMHFLSDANLTGTVQKTASSAAIVGSSTSFTTELSVGQLFTIPGTATEPCVVTVITDNTHLTCSANLANNASGQTATRISGAIIFPHAGTYIVSLSLRIVGSVANSGYYTIDRNAFGGSPIGAIDYTTSTLTGSDQNMFPIVVTYKFNQWDFIVIRFDTTNAVALKGDTVNHWTTWFAATRVK